MGRSRGSSSSEKVRNEIIKRAMSREQILKRVRERDVIPIDDLTLSFAADIYERLQHPL